MRINFDRLSQLAGLPAGSDRRSLREGASPMDVVSEEEREDEGMGYSLEEEEEEEDDDEANEMMGMMGGNPDDILEIDETMLVQELRRAKRIMNENKRRSLNESRRKDLFEAQLQQVIDEEVQNVLDEMNLNSQWVYGDRRPKRSRKGYTHQGSTLPGIGFRR